MDGREKRRRPTIADVAARAGVSVKTVSRVINNEPGVRPELADGVLAAIGELGFRRNPMASSLRSGRSTSTIGLIIEDLANPFYATVAAAVAGVARTHDTHLITVSSGEDPELERRQFAELCQRRVDGLIIVPAGSDHAYTRAEVEMGMRMVFLDRPPSGILADIVVIDNAAGARAGIVDLLEAGHRRIGVIVDSPAIYTARERLAGVREALAGAGVPYDDSLVRVGVADPEEAARAVAAMLDGGDPPTAFFAGNNRITVGAIRELCRRGDGAALTGFDDFELSSLMPRPLTIIGYDVQELGRAAAVRLFERIGGDTSWPAETVVPTRLLRRGLGQ
ncbi:LacI family DNA-binding transcriptional regulator [Actinomadura sp. LD22]|uniref:LacI family DNA-binding transcriptional regulator n=1 Tax=Actinomadura physcomitrii TaxID=2650748 RepID=A0A6I4MK92_9ACTN|nr:LacI family DNA-binding transcriptional regulator [Actinomadura physcomitrii]MWA02666.1 LacI family DNA-binding transcriptional regulator [Actinomadura physcomitrii]